MTDPALLLPAYQQQLLQRQQRAVLLCHHDYRFNLDALAPLVLDDQNSDQFAMHRYRDYLGADNHLVVLNFHHLIHADAVAALAGTVAAGGMLIINLPPQHSPFSERLLRLASGFELIIHICHQQALLQAYQQLLASPAEPIFAPSFPTPQQQQIITAMLNNRATTHLLLADRGRGKSTTLGVALAGYCGPEQVIVTAPKRSHVNTLMAHAKERAQFIAWERLLELPADNILLVIDEAAGLPIHILQQLCQRFNVWAIATTVEGYEGCGRGFVIRFVNWLGQQQNYLQHSLHQALRWRNPDDCEDWLNQLLCLTTMNQLVSWRDGYQWLHATALNDQQLHQVMQLLLEAHYQTSPNDLRLLLDDQAQQLLLYCEQGQLVGLAWIAEEGPIAAHLQADILAGIRRPIGNLLPQALAFNWQDNLPMQWRWWRVVRIAVVNSRRRQGYGSVLLQQIQSQARQQHIDAIGSSFGAAPEVLAFWQANQFQLVHRGVKRQMASGYMNAMVALGSSEIAIQRIAERRLSY